MQMNDEETQTSEPEKLASDHPVDAKILKQLNQLTSAKDQIAQRLLGLEMDKVRILAGAIRIDTEINRIFENILLERNLPPDTIIDFDSQTGKILKSSATKPTEPPSESL